MIHGIGGLPNNLPGYGVYVGAGPGPGIISAVGGDITLTGSSTGASQIVQLQFGELSKLGAGSINVVNE